MDIRVLCFLLGSLFGEEAACARGERGWRWQKWAFMLLTSRRSFFHHEQGSLPKKRAFLCTAVDRE